MKFSEKFMDKVRKHVDDGEVTIGDLVGLNKTRIIFYYLDGKILQDVRNVFKQKSEDDKILKKYYKPHWDAGKTKWDSIYNVAMAVNRRLRYVTDKDNWGSFEYWAKPIEIHNKKTDDCDGYAVLLCYLLRLFGLGEHDVFVRVGRVKYLSGLPGERHANVVVRDSDGLWYYPLEGSWYQGNAMKEFKRRTHQFDTHPRYFNTEWLTNDKHSFSNGRWFKFLKH